MTTTTTTRRRATVAPLRNALQRYFDRLDLWHDAAWYTPSEWADRGEPFGNGAVLSLTFEGPLYSAINGEYGWSIRDRIVEIARERGFWFEQGYAWSVHFYRFD
jgi:hypothetical protein